MHEHSVTPVMITQVGEAIDKIRRGEIIVPEEVL